jgi:hypothetical protein
MGAINAPLARGLDIQVRSRGSGPFYLPVLGDQLSPDQLDGGQRVTVSPQAVAAGGALRDLLDGRELDLLATDLKAKGPEAAARASGRITALAGQLENVFRPDLANVSPDTDVVLTFTADNVDIMSAHLLGGAAAHALCHRVYVEISGGSALPLCP